MRNAIPAIVAAFSLSSGFTSSGSPPSRFALRRTSRRRPAAQRHLQADRSPANAEQFDQLFQQVKNWGRWGADDQLGTVNLITAAKRKQALKLARTGLTVSLAHNPLTDKADDNAQPVRAHDESRASPTDTYRVSYHGYSHSHLDALCHILYKDQTYNGYARDGGQHRRRAARSSASTTSSRASSRAAC